LHRRSHRRAGLPAALLSSVLAFTPGAASAVTTPSSGTPAGDRFLDVRLGLTGQAPRPASAHAGVAARSASAARRVTAAREDLRASLGREAVLDVDPLIGTVAQLQRLDGALTAPSGAPPAAVARGFAADHATALGLDAADVAGLHVDEQLRSTSGLTVVRFGQSVDGIPAFDNGLRVGVDHAGRVLLVGGSPRSDLPASVGSPALSAAQALAALQDQTGIHRAVTVKSTDNDARRSTTFSTGDTARLVLFGARGVHLAWHLTYAASNLQHYDAVVDATTGEVLYRANLVKFFTDALVYHNYPGAPDGGARDPESLDAYLDPGATTMSGPNVDAFADVNDSDIADPAEEVDPAGLPFSYATDAAGAGCNGAHLCTWNHLIPDSWQALAGGDQWKANVVQTFWYANHFHDHLADDAPGFTGASGNFQGADPVSLNALDGAGSAGDGGPDGDHLDNANMLTPADGQAPRMQMYLFSRPTGSPLRDINGGDDAAVLYHEYTHGLSSRLVTNDDGTQALNSPHSGAMGEAWSDWYAQDLLVREGRVTDTLGTDGDIDMGRYTDSTPHAIRKQAVDCAVGSANAAACPAPGAPGTAGPGGFTLGDFAKVRGRQEVHSDGEIWAQTLWQLRQRFVTDLGEHDGSDLAEHLITDGMRLSIPEPSFLDMRNAILAADRNFTGGANQAAIWDVFAQRGMGFFAGVLDSSDVAPVEDFATPPPAGAPKGSITGTITDQDTHAPIKDVKVGIGGLSTDPSLAPYLATTTGADGHYVLGDVPQGAYPKMSISAAGYDKALPKATVGAGATDISTPLRRDWIATSGGAAVAGTNDASGDPYGCGAAAAVDQSQGAGWSALNTIHRATPKFPTAVYQLPGPVTVRSFGVDPSNTCGDDVSATAKDYTIETSPDGVTWTHAYTGASTAADVKQLEEKTLPGPIAGVRFVRLTLRSPLSESAGTSGHDFIDFSELEVYGIGPDAAPAGSLAASASSIDVGGTVNFDASSFRDPDGPIKDYNWDFDGDGAVDQQTTTPTASHAYDASGARTATVTAEDWVGGTGRASAVVTVNGPAAPPPPVGPTPPAATVKKATPALVLPRTGAKGKVSFKVTCKDACALGAQLTVSAATRRRLRLRSPIVGRLTPRTVNGTRTLTVSLTKDARARIRRRRVHKFTITLRITATVPGVGGVKTDQARTVSLKL